MAMLVTLNESARHTNGNAHQGVSGEVQSLSPRPHGAAAAAHPHATYSVREVGWRAPHLIRGAPSTPSPPMHMPTHMPTHTHMHMHMHMRMHMHTHMHMLRRVICICAIGGRMTSRYAVWVSNPRHPSYAVWVSNPRHVTLSSCAAQRLLDHLS